MKKRLFISTGYYSTLMASVISSELHSASYEDHILITIDRQPVASNRLWANRLHAWESVSFVSHEEYYSETINYEHTIDFFDEVYSPFPEMLLTVASAFKANNYFFYEEGLTSYLQFENNQYNDGAKYFCLHPHMFNEKSNLISLPINISKVLEKLIKIDTCYKTPILKGNNNVIVIGHGGFPDENKNELINNEYIEVVQDLSKKGYNVILLGHTRFPVSTVLLEKLNRSNDVNFQYIEHNSPISDLFLLKNAKNIKFISGIYSTLLVNAVLFFGFKALPFESETLSERQQSLKKIQSRLLN
ncbi:hypothetical protein JK229_16280 [Pantoea dispersa]|uniref:polysialyltransferase family glycosyltransferase n=1 Tax=Pantoea dispersa TaxID=59814 RepID=UPI001BAA54DA|nr:polysialyltransferase family glycosyltransferase [Pantoea dispersa]MBS0906679.1 hypothetical protein [Pantoea dispersa]